MYLYRVLNIFVRYLFQQVSIVSYKKLAKWKDVRLKTRKNFFLFLKLKKIYMIMKFLFFKTLTGALFF